MELDRVCVHFLPTLVMYYALEQTVNTLSGLFCQTSFPFRWSLQVDFLVVYFLSLSAPLADLECILALFTHFRDISISLSFSPCLLTIRLQAAPCLHFLLYCSFSFYDSILQQCTLLHAVCI